MSSLAATSGVALFVVSRRISPRGWPCQSSYERLIRGLHFSAKCLHGGRSGPGGPGWDDDVLSRSPFDDFVSEYGSTPRRGVFGLLVHELGRQIVGGTFAEAAPLPNEDDLITRFGVSRTTIREAMKTLASKGMVEIRTKTGTRVRPRRDWHHTDPEVMVWHYETGPTQEFLDALVDLRRALEPAAAARAAERATPTEVTAIERAFEHMCATVDDPVAHARADRAFHGAIFAATHNVIFGGLIDVIAIAIFGNAVLAPTAIVEGYRRSLPYHEAVLNAVRRKDPAAAAEAVGRLLDTWRPSPERYKQAVRPAARRSRLRV
jgi:GntR family transcriptional regulator, galactonate operon transcriptional repressor